MGTGIVKPTQGGLALAEMKEFASFPAATQRYVRRSLDIGLQREDAVARWARDLGEVAGMLAQARVYQYLDAIRATIPEQATNDGIASFMAPLIAVSAFDLGQSRLESFGAYRFLYERLVGAGVRAWLPSAFCAAAALPTLHPDRRRTLLQSLSEGVATAAGWSPREPTFFPHWVEKVERLSAA